MRWQSDLQTLINYQHCSLKKGGKKERKKPISHFYIRYRSASVIFPFFSSRSGAEEDRGLCMNHCGTSTIDNRHSHGFTVVWARFGYAPGVG